jgi:hypothetical protein
MRLQEWVAEEKGYFKAEGLDYDFLDELVSKDGKKHDLVKRSARIRLSSAAAIPMSVAPATGQ